MLLDRRDLFAIGRRSIVTTRNLRINPKVIDIEGSDVNIALGAMSMMGEETSSAFATCMRGLFVETAEHDALDRVVFDRYQETRLPAEPASVDLTLAFPAAGPSGVYQAGNRVQTPDGTQFATDVDAVFTGAEQSVVISATALIAGPDSNVPKGTISQFVEQPFNTTMTVTNPDDAHGGVVQETDPDFRARMLGFFGTVRRGVLAAIEFGARKVAGVAVAKAYETLNTNANGTAFPACMVQVVISDKNGGASSKMIRAVIDMLLTFRAAGIPVQVIAGVVRNESVAWKIAYLTGVNQPQAQAEVRAITVAVGQFLRPGDTAYRAALLAGARTVPGVVISADSLQLPLGDIVPVDNTQIIRFQPQDVAFV
jgi:uncharacterized phage protein gp47/JayE